MAQDPRAVAQAFADHLNAVLNSTITDGRLSLVELPAPRDMYRLARLEGAGPDPVALQLFGSEKRLFVEHIIEVDGEHVRTVQYSYRLQEGDARGSWLVRWEYYRVRPDTYEYCLGHLHLNEDVELGAKGLGKLHIPTARVALELVIWHLITEHGVTARSDDWQERLDESLAGFHERRTAD
jgi:hypothetical protein